MKSTYISDVEKLESTSFHPVSANRLRNAMSDTIYQANELDKLKKAIAYGKNLDNFLDANLMPTLTRRQQRLLHAAMGLITEGAELLNAVGDSIFGGKPLDEVNVVEELGDAQWYMALGASEMGKTLEEIQEINIKKLKLRYPDKFTEAKAIGRDVKAERELLETAS